MVHNDMFRGIDRVIHVQSSPGTMYLERQVCARGPATRQNRWSSLKLRCVTWDSYVHDGGIPCVLFLNLIVKV